MSSENASITQYVAVNTGVISSLPCLKDNFTSFFENLFMSKKISLYFVGSHCYSPSSPENLSPSHPPFPSHYYNRDPERPEQVKVLVASQRKAHLSYMDIKHMLHNFQQFRTYLEKERVVERLSDHDQTLRGKVSTCEDEVPSWPNRVTVPSPGHVAKADNKQDQKWEKASILVPFVVCEDGPHILVTVRSPEVAHFPGEISFPGGKWEEGDSNPIKTALREAKEEIALLPENVTIIGCLEDVCIFPRKRKDGGSREYCLSIVVGVINGICHLSPNSDEVKEIMICPLKTLFLRPNHILYCDPKRGDFNIFSLSVELKGKTCVIYGFTAWLALLICAILDLVPADCKHVYQSLDVKNKSSVYDSVGFRTLLNFAKKIRRQGDTIHPIASKL